MNEIFSEIFTVLLALFGTFIASVIMLAISFKILGFDFYRDDAIDVIFKLSIGATILYWIIELYLCHNLVSKHLEQNWGIWCVSLKFAFDPNTLLSSKDYYSEDAQEKMQTIIWWGLYIPSSILFTIIATIALWILSVVSFIRLSNSTFGEFILTLIKTVAIAVILGIFLRFVSGLTAGWIKDIFFSS